MKRLTRIGLAVGVAAVALVPLYGDIRVTPVTHSEWARLLLRGLGLDEMVRQSATASQVFSVLSWKESLAYPAELYVRGDGVTVREGRVIATGDIGGDVSYPIAIVRRGDYKVRLRLKGDPQRPVLAEITAENESSPLRVFQITPATIEGWIEGGTVHLDPGAYTTSVIMPPQTELEFVELAPPCLNPIEPYGGWQATALALNEDVAVTAIKALDREWDLPPAAAPIEVRGASFQAVGNQVTEASAGETLEDMSWLKAGPGGLHAVVFVNVPEDGLYTVSVFGIEGGGQSWLADSCGKAVVCPTEAPRDTWVPKWQTLMTSEFVAGPHFFAVTLAEGAAISLFRLERKKTNPQDYIDAMARICQEPGPAGEPITRAQAVEAMECVRRRFLEAMDAFCGDIPVNLGTVMASGQGAPGPGGPLGPGGPIGPGGPGTGPGAGPGTGPPTLGTGSLPPDVLPQPPGSPTLP